MQELHLRNRFSIAEDVFDIAPTASRPEIGRSSKDEFLTLDCAADLAWGTGFNTP